MIVPPWDGKSVKSLITEAACFIYVYNKILFDAIYVYPLQL